MKKISVLFVSFIIILILALTYFVLIPQIKTSLTPRGTPVPQIIFNANTSVVNGPMIANQFFQPPNYYTNVTQGIDLKINVTITSTGPEELVYVKNIQVWWYNPKVNLYTWSDPPNTGNDSSIQTSAFNYSSSPNPVSLQPSMSNSTILTLHIGKNAPTGQYSMYIDLEAKPDQPDAISQFVQLDQSYWFAMIINPS
jgi:hypothetical protein